MSARDGWPLAPKGIEIPFFPLKRKKLFARYFKAMWISPWKSSEKNLENPVRWSLSTKLSSNLGLSSKKTLRASELEREDIIQSRKEWETFQLAVDSSRLVFLDESGLKTNMTRLYGRSYGGERCRDAAPCGRWETVTILSSVRLDGTTESVLFEGALDRKMFDEYIKKILVPQLRPGDILVMDNLSVHKSTLALELVQACGSEIKFLPAYSPDLNPIEKMWSKIKQILRGLKPRTNEELFCSTKTALNMVSQADAQGWFISCGYV